MFRPLPIAYDSSASCILHDGKNVHVTDKGPSRGQLRKTPPRDRCFQPESSRRCRLFPRCIR